jgi:dinuclear metal center YbgI/SA1388 family protein
MAITRQQLQFFFDALLKPDTFNDYCPNGLQIEGSKTLKKIAFAVSATRDSINTAISEQADALIVHHGLFWKFHGCRTITGPFAQRVLPLVKHGINLFAYHLPLDAHAKIGNAATLGQLIKLNNQQPFGDYKGSATGVHGILDEAIPAKALQCRLEQLLNHNVIIATPDETQLVSSIGIITGGANGDWYLAYQQQLDAYITGEISEHDWHESQEHGIHMFAGGHHATEQFGIQALQRKTQDEFNIECLYIDSQNPA